MKKTLAIAVFFVALASSNVLAQSVDLRAHGFPEWYISMTKADLPAARPGQPIDLMIGHSGAGEAGANATQFNTFPNWTIAVISHYSFPCAMLLQALPWDIRFYELVYGTTPSAIETFVGITDAERNYPYPSACIDGYVATLQAAFPAVAVFFINTNYLLQLTFLEGGLDNRCSVYEYNQQMANLPNLFSGLVVIDVATFSAGPPQAVSNCQGVTQLPWGALQQVQFVDLMYQSPVTGYGYVNSQQIWPYLQVLRKQEQS